MERFHNLSIHYIVIEGNVKKILGNSRLFQQKPGHILPCNRTHLMYATAYIAENYGFTIHRHNYSSVTKDIGEIANCDWRKNAVFLKAMAAGMGFQ